MIPPDLKEPPDGGERAGALPHGFPGNAVETALARVVPAVAAALVILLGGAAFLGWLTSSPVLKSIVPGWVSMKANTALGLILCGGALAGVLWNGRGGPRRFRPGLLAVAGLVILFAALTLAEYFFNVDLGIDRRFFGDASTAMQTSHPGRMAPTTALCFVLSGIALIAAGQPFSARLRLPLLKTMGAALALIGLFALVGYAADASTGVRWWTYTGMAVHTALGFFLLGLGFLALVLAEEGRRWFLSGPTTLGFACGILVMLVAVNAAYHFTGQLWNSMGRVAHRQEVLREIQAFSSGFYNLESSQRGYIITGDEQTLDDRGQIRADTADALRELRRLTAGNPAQQGYVAELERLAAERLRWEDASIAARRDQGFAAAAALLGQGTGRALSKRLYGRVRKIRDGEYALLEADKEQAATATTTAFLLLPIGVFLSIAILLGGLFFLNAGVGERVAAEAELKEAEEEVHRVNAELEHRVEERTAQLQAANKELEAFSYSVSHDLRAPLRAVDGFSQAVLDDFGPQLPEDGHRYLEKIRHGAQKMGRLIDDLLTFSRLSRLPMTPKKIGMEEMVGHVLAELTPEAPAAVVTVGGLPPAWGDAALIRQVWLNLIANALKYSRRKNPARVEVGAFRNERGEDVWFVRDNGSGFDMQYAHKLFGVFQRLHRAEEFEGTGVGLALVQRIVHRHGGRIWCDARPGEGAIFSFTLNPETPNS